jgi:hypothetical protein
MAKKKAKRKATKRSTEHDRFNRDSVLEAIAADFPKREHQAVLREIDECQSNAWMQDNPVLLAQYQLALLVLAKGDQSRIAEFRDGYDERDVIMRADLG